ncbi:hypothetical protein [Capillimicrobium parvum]|nr:hypothetical protein [Capillimicrobium parvum]
MLLTFVRNGDAPRRRSRSASARRQVLDELPREPFTVPGSTMRQWRPYADAPTPAQASHRAALTGARTGVRVMRVLDRSPASPSDRARTMRVGLFAAPELPARIAVDLAEQLPELLDRQHDGSWLVALADEPLLARRESVEAILDAGCQARSAEGWDVAICLTDVPAA